MLILTTILAAYVALVGCYSSLAPENITVTFLNPTSVRVSWQTSLNLNNSKPIQKYDVTYKPTDASYRVVAEVAGNSEAVTLINLVPSTQYQLTVAALFNGKKYRSRPIVFRTLELSKTSAHQGVGALGSSFSGIGPPMSSQGLPDANYPMSYDEFGNLTNNSTTRELPTIRGVEVGIVVLVLIVWAGAIALFFNRWGKIRMLLPYQPDYKQEQGFKVPGTGVCSSGACNGQHSHQSYFRQHWPEEHSVQIEDRCTRNRINSAIFVSSEGKGFDSIEFLRRYGSQSVLCRKARSAENITSADQRRRLSEHRNWNSSLREHDNSLNETFELVECHTPLAEDETTDVTTSVVVSVPAVPSISGECTSSRVAVTAATVTADMSQKTRQKVTNLPTLSISGPSPPHEEFL